MTVEEIEAAIQELSPDGRARIQQALDAKGEDDATSEKLRLVIESSHGDMEVWYDLKTAREHLEYFAKDIAEHDGLIDLGTFLPVFETVWAELQTQLKQALTDVLEEVHQDA